MHTIVNQKEQSKKLEKSARLYYIDVLRCLACLSVVMIHCSSSFSVENFSSLNFWIGNVLNSLSRTTTSQEQASSKKHSVKLIQMIADNSLGIYAIHVATLYVMNYIWARAGIEIALLVIPVDFLVSIVLSLLATMLLKKMHLPIV